MAKLYYPAFLLATHQTHYPLSFPSTNTRGFTLVARQHSLFKRTAALSLQTSTNNIQMAQGKTDSWKNPVDEGQNEKDTMDNPQLTMLSLRSHLLFKPKSNSSSSSSSSSYTEEGNNNDDNKRVIELILASQSPRRREILDMMGLQDRYTVQVSPLDETSLQEQLSKEDPIAYTKTLAEQKARAILLDQWGDNRDNNNNNATVTTISSRRTIIPRIVLAADTIVAFQDTILEKPTSPQDAVRMLSQLQGNSHMVHTGVAVLIHLPGYFQDKQGQNPFMVSFVDTAQVKFSSMSLLDIDAYVNTGEPMDKAGSYGIQGMGGQFVESITGDFFTVMGLPMHRTSRALAEAVQTILRESNQLP